MTGESGDMRRQSKGNAPMPLSINELIDELSQLIHIDERIGHALACTSIPGGPDRCITGAVIVRGHVRLTTMPGPIEPAIVNVGAEEGELLMIDRAALIAEHDEHDSNNGKAKARRVRRGEGKKRDRKRSRGK